MSIHIVAFTGRGAKLADRMARQLDDADAVAPARFAGGVVAALEGSAREWANARFRTGNVLVFIGAIGIAVRTIAPLVNAKDSDPAVLCIDEHARHVIPLLAGHIGGANQIAEKIAEHLGAEAVITTATDLNDVFAVDTWAARNGYIIAGKEMIKDVSASLLDGRSVGLTSDFPVDGPLPEGFEATDLTYAGVLISLKHRPVYPRTLQLIPRCVTIGVGCRKDYPPEALADAYISFLRARSLPAFAVEAIATIDRKREEPAIQTLCRRLDLPLRCYSAEELDAVPGDFTASPFVQETVGVDNVCERAAVLASGGGRRIARKTPIDGATFAAAVRDWRVKFDLNGGH